MKDDPIAMVNDSPVRRLELAAMRAYRAKYPEGPPWLDLHIATRVMWLNTIERTEQNTNPGEFNP
jgi:hypothetical protein